MTKNQQFKKKNKTDFTNRFEGEYLNYWTWNFKEL